MKLVIVVQRYGAEINGGSELHARYVAERLSAHADVRVLTTCARDYVTWRNEWAPGEERVNGIPVERFAVARERDTIDFRDRSARLFRRTPLDARRARLAREPGADQPDADEAAVGASRMSATSCCCSASGTARRSTARASPRTKAVLVPTAERESALGLSIFPPIFRGVRAIMYNSFEERALITTLSSNTHVPGVVVGVGSQIPDAVDPARARQ